MKNNYYDAKRGFVSYPHLTEKILQFKTSWS